jgi:hypothetical protein
MINRLIDTKRLPEGKAYVEPAGEAACMGFLKTQFLHTTGIPLSSETTCNFFKILAKKLGKIAFGAKPGNPSRLFPQKTVRIRLSSVWNRTSCKPAPFRRGDGAGLWDRMGGIAESE